MYLQQSCAQHEPGHAIKASNADIPHQPELALVRGALLPCHSLLGMQSIGVDSPESNMRG